MSGTDVVVGVTLSTRSSTIFFGIRVVMSWMFDVREYFATLDAAGAGVTASPTSTTTPSDTIPVTVPIRRPGTTCTPSPFARPPIWETLHPIWRGLLSTNEGRRFVGVRLTL